MTDPFIDELMQSQIIPVGSGRSSWMGKPISDAAAFWEAVRLRADIADGRKDHRSRNFYCCRCGDRLPCPHVGCRVTEDAAHAERIRARYAFGKRFNPDHDEAIYTDPAP